MLVTLNKRQRIPGELADRLMAANRHTCCICHEPRQPVEKHHINGDGSDNDWNNLAVVCRNCHGLVTAKGSLGAHYSPGEVLRYKQRWEERCAEADKDEIDCPIEEIQETKLIEGDGGHEIYPFDMEEGDELVFSIDASDPVDVVVCDEEDAEAWSAGEVDEDDDEECPLPAGYLHRTGMTECRERSFRAPEDGCYVLLLVNWDDETAEIIVDAAVWAAEE